MWQTIRQISWVAALCVVLVGAASTEAMDIDPLDSGTVELQTKQLEDGQFVIALTIDVADIVAATVATPSDETTLIRVALEDAESFLGDKTPKQEAYASVSVSGDSLVGRMEHVLVYDASTISALEVTLFTRSGDAHPIRVQSSGWGAGEKHEIQFRPTRCYTIRFSCVKPNGQSCSVTKECCSQRVDYCADCNGCTVTCLPCSMLP